MLGWAVEVSQPTDQALAPVTTYLHQDLAVIGVSLTALLIVAAVLARAVIEPVSRLRRGVQAMSQGQFTPVRTGGVLELQELGAAFNRMGHEIEAREREHERILEQLRQANQKQQDLLHAVSHDLRSPLTVIHAQAELMLRWLAQGRLQGRQERGLRAILTATQRMNAMIGDLVESARLEAGQFELRRQPVDLATFLADLMERLAPSLPVGRVRVSAPAEACTVSADPDRLERILTNLLSNALKYSPADSTVDVSLKGANQHVELIVADRGPGISPEDVPHLFSRFFRSQSAQGHDSLGLGLYITRLLVQAHGGQVWVESKVGQGSAFHITLPCHAELIAHEYTKES